MDPTLILIAGALVVLIAFNWWSSRKRRATEETRKSTMVPGVEVMTNFGLFGTLISVDDVAKEAVLEIAPKTKVKVHASTLLKVITPDEPGEAGVPRSVEEAMAMANAEAEAKANAKPELNVSHAIPVSEPEYGVRVADEKKPVRRTAKKAAE
jgi:preprotein translocase subunit YajC